MNQQIVGSLYGFGCSCDVCCLTATMVERGEQGPPSSWARIQIHSFYSLFVGALEEGRHREKQPATDTWSSVEEAGTATSRCITTVCYLQPHLCPLFCPPRQADDSTFQPLVISFSFFHSGNLFTIKKNMNMKKGCCKCSSCYGPVDAVT